MSVDTARHVAMNLLPRLHLLIRIRQQAAYQRKVAPGEHQHKWTWVISHVDASIVELEGQVKEALELGEFRYKRSLEL